MMFPALPAMPRKLIDRSMDPPRRRPCGSAGADGEGREGRRREPPGRRINWPGEGPRREGRGGGGRGRRRRRRAAAEEIGAGEVGSDAAEASRASWLGSGERERSRSGHGGVNVLLCLILLLL